MAPRAACALDARAARKRRHGWQEWPWHERRRLQFWVGRRVADQGEQRLTITRQGTRHSVPFAGRLLTLTITSTMALSAHKFAKSATTSVFSELPALRIAVLRNHGGLLSLCVPLSARSPQRQTLCSRRQARYINAIASCETFPPHFVSEPLSQSPPRPATASLAMSLSLNGSRPQSHSPLRPGSRSRAFDPIEPVDASGVHPVFHEGRVAVITGAANGIGRAAAVELAKCAPLPSRTCAACSRQARLR